jgi:4-hydroxy-3-polyprenylbenzoate decarboxylase
MPKPINQLSITLALTGASGAMLGQKALELLELDSRVGEINLVLSAHSIRVVHEELQLGPAPLKEMPRLLLGRHSEKVQAHDNTDVGANIASGSYPSDGMLILPCSMGTLAAIAYGMSDNLIERAADVCLKERRPLVLAVREAPLSRIHLNNMLAVTDAGATVFPVVPAFYAAAESLETMAEQFVRRVLAHLGLAQKDTAQWQGTAGA